MKPKWIFRSLVVAWLLIAVVVVGCPLRTGQIRVGLDPISQNASPKAFWTAYLVSTVLFFTISVGVGFFVRSILL
jgi:hypothetical protein